MRKCSLKSALGGLSQTIDKCNMFGGGLKGSILESVFVFVLIFVRFIALGFAYNWQLDDYIQYKIYASTPLWEACEKYGLLGARPLSNSADIFFWGRFAGCMIIAVLLISVMYAVSAVILRRIFHRYFGTGAIFTVIVAILPLAFEGTYWLSASTRIVCGLFYASLSVLFLQRYLDLRKKRFLPFVAIFQLAAMFSYEQALLFTAALNVAVAVIFAASQAKSEKKRGLREACSLYFALPLAFVCAAIYFVFIKAFSDSALYGSAYSTADFLSLEFYTYHVPKTAYKIAKVFALGGIGTFAKGFVHGAQIIFEKGLALYGIVALLLSAFLCKFASARVPGSEKHGIYLKSLIVALWLFVAPLAVFFVMADPYFSMRNAVICLPGLALAIDSTARVILRKPALQGAVAGLLAVICLLGGVSELNGYKETTENDKAVIDAIIDAIPVEELCGKIGILNVEETYVDGAIRVNEHITGVTSSYWALTGAVNATLDCAVTGKVTIVPLPFETPMSYHWNRDMNDISSFDKIYLYSREEGALISVKAEPDENGGYTFLCEDGSAIARAYTDGTCYYGELLN